MITLVLGFLSFSVGWLGFSRAFKHKSLIIFIWIIVLYYVLTSIVAIVGPDNTYISDISKVKFMSNMLFCILGFYFSDIVFNKKKHTEINLNNLKHEKVFIYLEWVYWASFILTFFKLRTLDYASYNTSSGAGWAQVFFMLSSGIIFYFMLQKKWFKIGISILMMILIVSVLNIRSLLYFILMPIAFYFIYNVLFKVNDLRDFVLKCTPLIIFVFVASFIVSYLRFGFYSLPETELTTIALDSMERWNFEYQYANSIFQYLSGFLSPIRNALSIMGLEIPDFMKFVPSVPQLNAMIRAQVTDMDFLEDAYHMPATIFYDFLMSWNFFAPLAAFLVYWYFIKAFNSFQKSGFRLVLFSSLVGWHFYMLMRGSVDTCASAMAYPVLLGFIVYYMSKKAGLIKFESKE